MKPSIIESNRVKTIVTKLAVALFWIAVWQLAYYCTAQEILLVSPVRAFVRLLELTRNSLFWMSVGSSCVRILSGFILAVCAGTLLAVLTASSNLIRQTVSPLLDTIRATPVASFIILSLYWMSDDHIPTFMAFLMVVPMIWSNIHTGIVNTDKQLLEMARIYRFPFWRKIEYIYIPAVMPYFVSACSTGIGFAWKSGVAAEVIATPRYAVGKQIYNAKIYLETPDLFAWTIAVVILSVVIEKAAMWGLGKIKDRVLRMR
jgi:NitT/TauT family transport system permease protein